MNIALVMLSSLAMLILGFALYSRFVCKAVGVDASKPTPATTIHDGVDYVPTRPLVLFGHHFAAIAAAGPIVGPTLALYFGFLPAWLWIMLGVTFIGAVHDFTALFVAVREGGRSIAEVARKTLGKPGFVFYVLFAILLCLLLVAAFLQLTALALTSTLPPDDVNLAPGASGIHFLQQNGALRVQIGGVASMSVIVMTVLAPVIGWMIYRRHMKTWFVTLVSVVVSLASIVVGYYHPITLMPTLWIFIITVYVFFASWIPVWIILQPRDFVNAQILFLGLASMIVGVLGAGFGGAVINVPVLNVQEAMTAPNLGALWPFLFITIACGAVSGAHGLVCGGTSCKQISNEKHARYIGYGGMLLEGLLALCVILLLSGGMDFAKYKSIVYPAGGGSNAPLAFALALGNVLQKSVRLPTVFGTIWGILLLEGFLVTTIDALVRLARYLFEELWVTILPNPPAILKSRIFNSLLVVAGFLTLTFSNAYLKIWPIFGAANQLLAALTLIAVTAWLAQKSKKYWFTALPAAFMVVTTVASLILLLNRYVQLHSWSLLVTDIVLLVLAAGVVVLTVRYFYNLRVRLTAEATR
ncbi:MAG TPA: carbon starvation CstA family protein [Verrucomicrobiae bacterium]|nr:carbon starvation CstA family protein [Verrucomicrobiae bacterium]